MENVVIYSTPAALWDGMVQLPGILELKATELVFNLKDFQKSHLNLVIPLSQIDKVEDALVYDLARNGLHIQNKNGTHDLFVIEDFEAFKMAPISALVFFKKNS